MENNKEFYENVGYFSAIAQLLSFVSADQNDGLDDFILSFELREKDFRKYLDVLDYSIIANDFNNWNEAAQKMWVS